MNHLHLVLCMLIFFFICNHFLLSLSKRLTSCNMILESFVPSQASTSFYRAKLFVLLSLFLTSYFAIFSSSSLFSPSQCLFSLSSTSISQITSYRCAYIKKSLYLSSSFLMERNVCSCGVHFCFVAPSHVVLSFSHLFFRHLSVPL